jgi:NAD(P)-dependent dehydrogenase (short-subunit alcohol dehydrogenase family)
MTLPDLQGRTAVLTGASRGLGAGLAEEFHARGMRLALCARTPCPLSSKDILNATVDVREEAAVEDFARQAAEFLGPIDLWINNAGQLDPVRPLREVTLQEFRSHLEVNVQGVFLGSRAFARLHRQAAGPTPRDATLINISSGAATHAFAGWGAYCTGKSGLDRLTECLQLEEQETGLRCYAIAPGVIDTAMQERIRSTSADDFPAVEQFHQLKRKNAFNSMAFVAEHLLAYSFDPDQRPDQVVVRVPSET